MQPIPNHSCSHVGCSSMPVPHVTCKVQASTQHGLQGNTAWSAGKHSMPPRPQP
jgi:hypothetical protein